MIYEGAYLIWSAPLPDGIAADSQQGSYVLPRLGVTTHAQIAHRQADVLATIMLTLEALFQVIRMFGDWRI